MHEQFVAPTKKNADVIIPEGANRMAVDLLVEKVEAELGSTGEDDGDEPFPFEVADDQVTRVELDSATRGGN